MGDSINGWRGLFHESSYKFFALLNDDILDISRPDRLYYMNFRPGKFPKGGYLATLIVVKWLSVPIFRSNWEGGNFSTKIRWIGKFSEVEKFPINRKIFHFISGPVSVPIFRSNWEGGNFPIKSDDLNNFQKLKNFR